MRHFFLEFSNHYVNFASNSGIRTGTTTSSLLESILVNSISNINLPFMLHSSSSLGGICGSMWEIFQIFFSMLKCCFLPLRKLLTIVTASYSVLRSELVSSSLRYGETFLKCSINQAYSHNRWITKSVHVCYRSPWQHCIRSVQNTMCFCTSQTHLHTFTPQLACPFL